jgi:hypothetical protein
MFQCEDYKTNKKGRTIAQMRRRNNFFFQIRFRAYSKLSAKIILSVIKKKIAMLEFPWLRVFICLLLKAVLYKLIDGLTFQSEMAALVIKQLLEQARLIQRPFLAKQRSVLTFGAGNIQRRTKADIASDDVIVEYLEGDKQHGIVVLGLNRPKVPFLVQ